MGRGWGETVRTCLKAEADGRARKVLLGSEICQPVAHSAGGFRGSAGGGEREAVSTAVPMLGQASPLPHPLVT